MTSNKQVRVAVSIRRRVTLGILSCLVASVVAHSQNDGIRFRIIAVSTESDAESLHDEIEAGAPFDDLAQQFSIDQSGVEGGSMGPIPVQSLRQEYRDALSVLEPGETSPVVALDNAFLIFHLNLTQEELWMEQRNAGHAAFDQGAIGEAEELFNAAVSEAQELGSTDLRFVWSLAELGGFYQVQGRFAEAQDLYQRAFEIQAAELGLEDAAVGATLNDLAEVLRMQDLFEEAEGFYLRSLANLESSLGRDHLNVGILLNNLALLYQVQGLHARAQPLFLQSLAIMEQNIEPDASMLAPTLANLGRAYHAQANYAEARRRYRRALEILEPEVGADDPIVLEVRRFLNAASGRRPLPQNIDPSLQVPLQ
jgi:tetratricopeptide (TPR) repeat protein